MNVCYSQSLKLYLSGSTESVGKQPSQLIDQLNSPLKQKIVTLLFSYFFLLDYKECPFFRLKMSGDHKDQHPSSTESKNIHLFKFQNRYGENAIITTTGEVKQKDIEDYFETIVKNRILPKG